MTRQISVVRTIEDLRQQTKQWHQEHHKVALVPTMGALHQGHGSLVTIARQQADKVIATIFVNPTQFGAGEDLDQYPRTLDEDLDLLSALGTDLVFIPDVGEIYPDGFATKVSVSGPLTECLCGASRPDHFDGVATIVTKLLLQSLPDCAIFGEKDYQQLMVIKRFVKDLNIPVEIIGAPIVREADGLALSSRNSYLSSEDRKIAPELYKTLTEISLMIGRGQTIEGALTEGREQLKSAGFQLDYLELRQPSDFRLIKNSPLARPARLFAAVFLGSTRLIDNVPVESSL